MEIKDFSSINEVYSYSEVDTKLSECKISIKNITFFKSELDINDRGYKVYMVSEQWNGTCEYNHKFDCLCLRLNNGDNIKKLEIG